MGLFSHHKSNPTRGWAFLPTDLYFLLPVIRINLQVLTDRWDDLFTSGFGFGFWIWRHRNGISGTRDPIFKSIIILWEVLLRMGPKVCSVSG